MKLVSIKFAIIASLLVLTSCASLQYRATEAEIKAQFAEKKIETDFSYFDVDSLDLKIRVQRVTNQNSEKNLLFFHGSPSSLSAWRGYLMNKKLQKEANLYAIDRPGYGYSNFGKPMTSIDLQAKVMSALINKYNLQNVILVGASYGGPLVARIAVLNPNIKGVIMVSPAIDPAQEKRIWQSDFTQFWGTRWLVPTGYRVAGDEKTVHAEELVKIEKDWQKVLVPVYHIHGDTDDIVPYGNVNYTKDKFSNIKIITIEGRGHEIAWRNSDLMIPYILEMFEEIK